MVEVVKTKVTPSLHPQNITHIDGYSEETAAVLKPTEDAFKLAYESVAAVHAAREAARQNPTWNESAQVIATQAFADKVFDKVARSFDSVRDRLVKGIASLEQQLSAPVESKASSTLSVEIRNHCKSLNIGGRMSFIRQAMMDHDERTVSAVLGAPAYLSGLDQKMAEVLLREYHSRHSPELANRLKAMQGAKDLIERNAPIIHTELERAVGMSGHEVKKLREAKTKAEQAMVLPDVA